MSDHDAERALLSGRLDSAVNIQNGSLRAASQAETTQKNTYFSLNIDYFRKKNM